MNLTTYIPRTPQAARAEQASQDTAARIPCQQTTTGPLALKCENPRPHEPRHGCLYVHTYVPDGRHDDDRSDW